MIDINHLVEIVKAVTEIVNRYMKSTQQEMDSIKNIVHFKLIDIKHSLQNMITNESIKHGNEMREFKSTILKEIENQKYMAQKQENLESILREKTENNKNTFTQDKHKNSNKQALLSAILHDKKKFDNGIMALNDGSKCIRRRYGASGFGEKGDGIHATTRQITKSLSISENTSNSIVATWSLEGRQLEMP